LACPKPVFGVADPEAVIRNAAARAVEMLNNTIQELVKARSAVCAGSPPAWPTLSDIAGRWLKFCLSVPIDNIGAWTAGTFSNGSVAEVVRRLIRVRNLIASNEIRYVCGDAPCCRNHQGQCAADCHRATVWAWVCIPDNCASQTPRAIIHLCKCFWLPGDKYGGHQGEKYDAATHAEFQAQAIIHETSHLTHCTRDFPPPLRTIGGAQCLALFVAATNNSPIHPCYLKHCPCPGAPGMPSQDELRKIDDFCARLTPCNPPPLPDWSPRRQSRGMDVEMDNPPFNLADAENFAKAGAEIRAQLNRNFLATDEPGYLDRRRKLRIAFNAIPDSFAEFLYLQLTDKPDPLSQLFHYKLHPATVNEMLGILWKKMGRVAPTL
jgi:hypothetical protein